MRCFLGFCILLFTCFSFSSSGQKYDQNYFDPPLKLDLILAGNFGELRTNHFHAGLDIKTNGKEGYKIYAVADGYVSRIKVSPYGYGKALYITHPNGYVSVYAHLNRYSDSINTYVREQQELNESFAIELFPEKNALPVKKGEIVAYSGNSGSSSGPHLHFEIREEKSEIPVNPLLWGLKVADKEAPVITQLAVYPLEAYSRVNNNVQAKYIIPIKYGNNYWGYRDTILVSGKIGLGIDGWDSEDLSNNHNGLYSVEMVVNGKKVYKHTMNKVGFDETHYINCHIDYPAKLKHNKRVQRSYLLKNNQLNIYDGVIERGILDVKEDSVYLVNYKVKDYYGNSSTARLILKGVKRAESKEQPSKHDAVFHFSDTNKFVTEDIRLKINPNLLYEDIRFQFKQRDTKLRGHLSPVYSIHNKYVPLHNYYQLSIKTPLISDSLKSKLTIVRLDDRKKYSVGGDLDSSFISCSTRYFGDYVLMLDTTAPVIKPLNIYNNKTISGQSDIRIKVTDNLSGIDTYKGYIDGKWVLFEYDAKKAQLIYIKEGLNKGDHELRLVVEDECKNQSIFEIKFKE